MLDSAPDQHEAEPGLAAFAPEVALVPRRRQHERVRDPVAAGENPALSVWCGLEQIGVDAAFLELAVWEPGDTGRMP